MSDPLVNTLINAIIPFWFSVFQVEPAWKAKAAIL